MRITRGCKPKHLYKVRKLRPPYYWAYSLQMDPDDAECVITCYTGSHRKAAPEGLTALYLKFRSRIRKHPCYTGWDIDRHRFFVEGRTQKDIRKHKTNKRSRFLRESWERNHGYADRSQSLPKNIHAFLASQKGE